MAENVYKVIGLMSGTSLDGLDIALCNFSFQNNKWNCSIEKAKTVVYTKEWKNKLGNAHKLSSAQLIEWDATFGKFIGKQVSDFIKKNKISNVDLVSSHGHTVFHQPEKGFTLQIGSGACIAAIAGIKTVCDFRSGDVALGGQGAPLVPVGDELLFAEYDACLNIGGIANISFNRNNKRVAFDICPANTIFNYLAAKKGLAYDKGGKLAARGEIHWNLLKKLNSLSFYKDYKSKSLGREWIEKNIFTTVDKEKISLQDKLATVSEHAALQVARVLNHFKIKNVLLTGGGAYNNDFISRVSVYSNSEIIVPNNNTIQFKEALIFAFLGVLRVRGEINCFKNVTGAKRDSCGGAIY
ncbi:MAG TPA: anhydro-N-acetylmuramic acid kinase [Bacteroidia bacterium]|jgi:anhydro-N-acetylmuramic acid kinase|nr:anhydro-N-acetylmuramic acid kinase [Bacteroidia bacterium]